jgi:hypothetical protein
MKLRLALCSSVHNTSLLRHACLLGCSVLSTVDTEQLIALMIGTLRFFESLVTIYRTTLCHVPEHGYLRSLHPENLKYRISVKGNQSRYMPRSCLEEEKYSTSHLRPRH